MGGFTGFGPVIPEPDEPVFHHGWEPRAFAMVLGMGMTGSWNIDEARRWREQLPAPVYWGSSYYEMRFYALADQMTALGLITAEEYAAGHKMMPAKPVRLMPAAAMIPGILASGGPSARPSNALQGFAIGDKIRARNIMPSGHTRLPRYARGRAGEIVKTHGTHVFPDSSAQGLGDDPQWLYTVRFTALELWGKDTGDAVCIDLWEPYLEALA